MLPRGAGYNIIQSKLAIGAGELTGMGLFKGNQTQLGFLYPKTTDFIFAVIGEEMGFVVAGAVIIVYVFLVTKCLYVAKTAKDDKQRITAISKLKILLVFIRKPPNQLYYFLYFFNKRKVLFI
jgi:rod shape determining protein RodA